MSCSAFLPPGYNPVTAIHMSHPTPRKLYIRTFGCQMNEYDSDKMVDVLNADQPLEIPTSTWCSARRRCTGCPN